MSLGGADECYFPGCTARRRTINHWFVVFEDLVGVHVYSWSKCPEKAMKNGKHLCGLAHMSQYVSQVMTPDTTDPNRETTLELKPPLTREGTKPEAEGPQEEEQTEKFS